MALEARQADDWPPAAPRTSTPDQSSSGNRSPVSSGKPPTPTRRSSLLRAIASRSTVAEPSTLIIPVAFIQSLEDLVHPDPKEPSVNDQPLLPPELLRCFDDGAADVIFGPLSFDRIRSIASQVYRFRKDRSRKRASSQEARKSRKRSWVGFDDRKPYAYLREEMYASSAGQQSGPCITCTDLLTGSRV